MPETEPASDSGRAGPLPLRSWTSATVGAIYVEPSLEGLLDLEPAWSELCRRLGQQRREQRDGGLPRAHVFDVGRGRDTPCLRVYLFPPSAHGSALVERQRWPLNAPVGATPRERRVFELVYLEQQTNEEVAEALAVTEGTVRNHLQSVRQKLGAAEGALGRSVPRRCRRKTRAALARLMVGLGERERGIVLLVARGLSNLEVARAFGLAEPTIRSHLTKIYRRLDVRGRHGLAARLRELGCEAPGLDEGSATGDPGRSL